MIFLELFLTFFKIGLFTFGGGYAMLPLIQEEVISHGWMELSRLVDFIAVSESTPGPFAVNSATFIGSELGGVYGPVFAVLGSACATLGVVLPSFIVILIVAKCYDTFKENRIVKGCMTGLKPAVVGLIGTATVKIAATVLFPAGFSLAVFSSVQLYVSLAIFAVCTVLALKKVHPILIICLAAVCGIVSGLILQ